MSRLNSDLKRLLRWAGRNSPTHSEDVPVGFAVRVVAAWKPQAKFPSLFLELHQAFWSCASVALVVIACGLYLLLHQPHLPEPVTGFSTALSFAANNLTR